MFTSKDGLKAYLLVSDVYKKNYPSSGELLLALDEHSVYYGVKKDAVLHMEQEQVCNMRILVAEGLPAVHGVAGRLKLLIDISQVGKPKILENGKVDHRDLGKVINVKKGDELIRRIPPVIGKDGRSVLGNILKPPLPEDVYLRISPGTLISEEDPDLLISASDGAVILDANDNIEVRTTKIITHDIDYSTGNIVFSGDLKIRGVIKSGFSVEADGNVLIEKHVEDAILKCNGDMEITRGAVGSKNGCIDCGGDIKVHHLENFTVIGKGKLTVTDAILHSRVKIEGDIKAKSIIGGQVETSSSIEVESIGALSETKTVVKAGSIFYLLKQKEVIEEKKNNLDISLDSCNEELFLLVKNGMNDKGKLTEEQEVSVGQYKVKRKSIQIKISELLERFVEIEEKLSANPNPFIKVKTVYPNSIIRFGLIEKSIKDHLNNIIFSTDDNRIVVTKC